MKSIQDVFIGQVPAFPQVVATSTTFNSNPFDISKCPRNMATSLRILFILGATDTTFTTLKVQGTDDDPTGSPTWHDLVGTRYGTDNDVDGIATTLPGTGSDNNVYGWLINANSGNYRYYRVEAVTSSTGSAGALITIVVEADQVANIQSPIAYATGFKAIMAYPVVQQTAH